ncbi:hypothetical protein LINPERHAP1_LOCUS14014 [Linum perenne]
MWWRNLIQVRRFRFSLVKMGW